jgi:hypothetical protein
MSIQWIRSDYSQGGTKVILWRTGNYRYQIETITGYGKRTVNFTAEYNDALARLEKEIENLNFAEI